MLGHSCPVGTIEVVVSVVGWIKDGWKYFQWIFVALVSGKWQ